MRSHSGELLKLKCIPISRFAMLRRRLRSENRVSGEQRLSEPLLHEIVHCTLLFVPNNIARQRLFVAEESGKEPVWLIKA